MTVRGGRGPRDPEMPAWRASDGRGNPPVRSRQRRPGDGGGPRIPGALKFLLFAGGLAAIVLVVLFTAMRPIVRAGIVGWAWDNPSSIVRFPFIGDLVKEDLGALITAPAGTDGTDQVFTVDPGDTIGTLAPRLREKGFVVDERAFMYVALTTGLGDKLAAGQFLLRETMTPAQVANALVTARLIVTTKNITFREGLRIEQMTALLQTIESGVDPQAFYDLARHPPPELLADYEWLELPEGASLEGFLYPDTYQIITSSNGGQQTITDADALIRKLLDNFFVKVGEARMNVPESRGLTFYQIVTLASIVEHEAIVDEERPLIAGAYQNRLDGLKGTAKILNADPTVTYAKDTMALAKIPFEEWRNYFFWKVPPSPLASFRVDDDLKGYQTYQVGGLIPGPISTPSLASIEAALNPDKSDGYLYFVAIPDTKTHAFAKTLAEHNANLRKYGYS